MPEVDINYWAVLVAAVASMAVGSIWYAPPVFGNKWMVMIGKTKEDLKGGAMHAMLVAIASALVMSYVLAHMVDYTQATTWQEGMQTGFWLWLGFIATTTSINYAFQGRKLSLYLLDSANHLVTIMVMAMILAVWA